MNWLGGGATITSKPCSSTKAWGTKPAAMHTPSRAQGSNSSLRTRPGSSKNAGLRSRWDSRDSRNASARAASQRPARVRPDPLGACHHSRPQLEGSVSRLGIPGGRPSSSRSRARAKRASWKRTRRVASLSRRWGRAAEWKSASPQPSRRARTAPHSGRMFSQSSSSSRSNLDSRDASDRCCTTTSAGQPESAKDRLASWPKLRIGGLAWFMRSRSQPKGRAE